MWRRFYNEADSDALKKMLESSLKSLYDEYYLEVIPQGNLNVTQSFEGVRDFYGTNEFYRTIESNTSGDELATYLKADLETNMDINVLEWWKVNSSKYPILANIARDVLAIPITTVASESAFSTGERVLDPYRSSLTPITAEALICTQDWFKGPLSSLITNEDFENLERIEQELIRMEDGPSCSSSSTSLAREDD